MIGAKNQSVGQECTQILPSEPQLIKSSYPLFVSPFDQNPVRIFANKKQSIVPGLLSLVL